MESMVKLGVEIGDFDAVTIVLAATIGTWLFQENSLGTPNY